MSKRVFPDHIFKAYDIRGVYPTELDEDLAQRIGKAFTTFLQQEENKTNVELVIVTQCSGLLHVHSQYFGILICCVSWLLIPKQ